LCSTWPAVMHFTGMPTTVPCRSSPSNRR
jgi:hypothetical protein